MNYRIFSFGGGVQSVSVMVLQSLGKVQYDEFVFANVGEDSENPGTLEYYREIVVPFADKHGVKLAEVRKNGKTLYQDAIAENRDIPLPIYLGSGSPSHRGCTIKWKIIVVDKYLRDHKNYHSTLGIGISMDEIHRARTTEEIKFGRLYKSLEYPLIDLRMTREDCRRVIADAGLPEPPKSSCWFCPYQHPSRWLELKENNPILFEKACQLEERLNVKRAYLGRDAIFLHRKLLPLRDAVGAQMGLFNETEICESGYCMV
jgi:hypothetical protein